MLQWYAARARSLPWRAPGAGAWGVLVSEVMLQQTPVARVLPAYAAWMRRWPTPSALSADSVGAALRAWGRLGYPRRALRLHEAATVIDERHDGRVPATYDELRALPGVGDYTAAAVVAFAYRQRQVVLDTNVRRVFGRLFGGHEFPAGNISNAERALAADLLPADPETAATWSVAAMELGALVCTARSPRCESCPVSGCCSWRQAGYPMHEGPPRRGQPYHGTDRHCRGRILALLRDSDEPLPAAAIDACWDDPRQRRRALTSLIDDGLVAQRGCGRLALP